MTDENLSNLSFFIPQTIGKYQVVRQIGKGGFAVVVLGFDPKTYQKVAIKIFDREEISKGGFMKYLENELRLCARFNHPNIVKIYDIIYTEKYIMMVMEYIENGDLQSLIKRNVHFSIQEQLKIAYEVLSAIDYLHKRGISHRDIKPENILFDQDFHAKLIDFGLSREGSDVLSTYCGTPFYMAPDLVSNSAYDGMKADIWAFGVTLHVLATNQFPFEVKSELDYLTHLSKGKVDINILPKGIIGQLCKNALVTEPAERLDASQLIQMIEDSLHTANILNNSGVQQPIKQSLPSLNRYQTPSSARSKKVLIDDKSLNKMKFNVRMRVFNKSTERMKK